MVDSEYAVLGDLGRGGFGSVRRVKRKSDGKVFACKRIAFETHVYETRENFRTRVQREVDLLNEVDHPNIVQYFNAEWVDDAAVMIFMEFVGDGNLEQYVQNSIRNSSWPSESESWSLISQLLAALAYCHHGLYRIQGARRSTKVVETNWTSILHRDIKPKNVLIRRTTVGVQYKLCDFGLSVLHSPTDDASLSYAGTRGFIAPEITMDHADWSAKADVYSFGCTLYYVYERRTPPNDQSSIGLARRTPEPPVRAPPSIQTVVQACLSPSPQSRPDSQELFEEASSHLDETILLLATRHGLDSSHFKSETPLQEQLLSPMSPGSQVHLSKLDSGRSMVDITSSSQSTLRAPPLPPRPRSQNQDSGIKRGALVEYKPSDTDPRTPAKAQETAVDHQVLEALEAEQLEPFPRPLGLFRQFFATRQETLQVKEDNSISEKGFEARTVDGRFLLKLQGDRFALSWRRKVVDAAGNFLFTLRERESTFHTVLSGEDAKGSRIFELRGKGDVRTTRVVGTFVGIGGREESLVMKGDFFDRNAEIRHEQTGLLIAKIKRQGAWKLEFNIAQPIIYRLEVAQNVDMALVVAMCMVLDKRKK